MVYETVDFDGILMGVCIISQSTVASVPCAKLFYGEEHHRLLEERY